MNNDEIKSREKNFISAVVYVHNDSEALPSFLRGLIATLEENFEHSEIILVNDFSTDDSNAKIKSVKDAAKTSAISILNLSYYHGLEVAMNAGVDLAIGDFVLEIDEVTSDCTSENIMKVYRKVLEGFDIVSAVPVGRQRLSSKIFYSVYSHFSEGHKTMRTETFRILSRRAINRINEMNRRVPYRKGVYLNCGLSTSQVLFKPSAEKRRKISREAKRYRRTLAEDTLVLFTHAGYSLARNMTVFMILISIFMAAYTLYIYATKHPIAGWTTTILFLSLAFFGLFGILTIIIKYLQILVDLSFRRTEYSFESIEKLTK